MENVSPAFSRRSKNLGHDVTCGSKDHFPAFPGKYTDTGNVSLARLDLCTIQPRFRLAGKIFQMNAFVRSCM